MSELDQIMFPFLMTTPLSEWKRYSGVMLFSDKARTWGFLWRFLSTFPKMSKTEVFSSFDKVAKMTSDLWLLNPRGGIFVSQRKLAQESVAREINRRSIVKSPGQKSLMTTLLRFFFLQHSRERVTITNN